MSDDASMIVAWIEHHVRAERADAYLAATLANARATRNEPGNVRFDVLQDPEDPLHFVLFEAYVDKAGQQAHFATEHFRAWKAAVDGAIESATFHRWNALHVPSPPG